jgi:O-antigen/teichoic acid export membrane protein
MTSAVQAARALDALADTQTGSPTGAGPQARPAPLSLRRNFSWTLAGNIVYAASQWGMLIVLAKLGGPMMVGLLALGLAVTAPVMQLASLALRPVQATDIQRDFAFGHYLALRLLATAAALAAIALIAWTAGYRGERAWVVLLVGVAKAFESVSDIYYGQFQREERLDRVARSMMIKGILSLAALGLATHLTGSAVWGAAALAAAWGAVLLGYDAVVARRVLGAANVRPAWEWARLAKLAWLALPLGVVVMLLSLTANIPRYFVEAKLGTRALGVFAALAYLLMVGGQLINALGQAASPRLARALCEGNPGAFGRLLAWLLAIGAGVGLVGVAVALVAGGPILRLLYGPEFADWNAVLIVLMSAGAVSYVAAFLGYGMTAARQFRVQPLIGSMSLAVTAGACAILVPRYGLVGAAWAMGLGAAAQVILAGWSVAWALKRAKGVVPQR